MLIGALHCWENFQLNFNRFLLLSSVPLNTLVVTVFWIFSWALLVTPLHLVKTLFEVSGVDITLPILQPGWPYQWGGSPKHIFLTSWKINCVWISQSNLDISRKKTFSSYKFQHFTCNTRLWSAWVRSSYPGGLSSSSWSSDPRRWNCCGTEINYKLLQVCSLIGI